MTTSFLRGGTAVITGAGSGFGLELARLAAASGMRLVLADIQADALERAAAELRAQGAEVWAQQVDVSRAQELEHLAEGTLTRFGAPHLVFNNAGVATGGLIWEASTRDWEWVLGVNLMGVVHGVRVFTPMMLEAARRDPQYRGHMVNTASMAGLVNAPNMGVYNVSKHAVVSLSETLYHDLSLVTEQVRCSVLCPYFVPTGTRANPFEYLDKLPWIPQFNIQYQVGVDGLSLPMVVLTALLMVNTAQAEVPVEVPSAIEVRPTSPELNSDFSFVPATELKGGFHFP